MDVSPGHLGLQYPSGSQASQFTLVIGTFNEALTISSLNDVPGLDIVVSGNINTTHEWSFVGQQTNGSLINDFEFWNCTFFMPDYFEGVPTLNLDLTYKA